MKRNRNKVDAPRQHATKKTYVLDTNVLMSDPTSIFAFEEHDVIVPMAVLEELDRHKSRPDEVGRNVRQVTRSLDSLRERGSLLDGVKLKEGGTLKVGRMLAQAAEPGLDPTKADNLIIEYARMCTGAVLVSKDINVRVKCDSLGIKCEDYLKMRVADDQQKFYRGVDAVDVPEDVIDRFYADERVVLSPFADGKQHTFCPNQIVMLKHARDGQTTKSAVTKCHVDPAGVQSLVPILKIDQAFGLKPRNKEQTFSLDLLFDPNVKLLTLVGPSGTGKTLLTLAAALEQLKGMGDPSKARYERLIVTRPVQPVGKEIGFLPGTLHEKMEPWIAPVRDNLDFLVNNRRPSGGRRRPQGNEGGKPKHDNGMYLSLLQDRGLIEIDAITFIRGRSIPNAFIVIDEAQNLSMHELKTIVTRVGDGTKIVLTGDIEQIDNVHVDAFTNGLTYAVERFKGHAIAGHVTLTKGERSELATLASKIL